MTTTFSPFNPGNTTRECPCGCCAGFIDEFEDLYWQADPSTPSVQFEVDSGSLFIYAASQSTEIDPGGEDPDPDPPDPPDPQPDPDPDPPDPDPSGLGGYIRRRVCCGEGKRLDLTAQLDATASTINRVAVGVRFSDDDTYATLAIWTRDGYEVQRSDGAKFTVAAAPTPTTDDNFGLSLEDTTAGIDVFLVVNGARLEVAAASYVGTKGSESWVYIGGLESTSSTDGDTLAKVDSFMAVCDCSECENNVVTVNGFALATEDFVSGSLDEWQTAWNDSELRLTYIGPNSTAPVPSGIQVRLTWGNIIGHENRRTRHRIGFRVRNWTADSFTRLDITMRPEFEGVFPPPIDTGGRLELSTLQGPITAALAPGGQLAQGTAPNTSVIIWDDRNVTTDDTYVWEWDQADDETVAPMRLYINGALQDTQIDAPFMLWPIGACNSLLFLDFFAWRDGGTSAATPAEVILSDFYYVQDTL